MSRRIFLVLLVLIDSFFVFSLLPDLVDIRAGQLAMSILGSWLANAFHTLARWQERWFTLSIVLYTILALVLAHYLLPRLARTGASFWILRKKIRAVKELKSDEQQLTKQLVELYEDIGKELKLLQEIGYHRSLYPDERYLRTKLSQYQKTLKTLIPQKQKRQHG